MRHSSSRRAFLLAMASVPLLTERISWAGKKRKELVVKAQLEKLESAFDGRLGMFALDTATDDQLEYRVEERFPVCSTFKVLAAAAILKRSEQVAGLMRHRIKYQRSQLVDYSPITKQHLAHGMTVAELCAAAIQYSDNTAGNLLLQTLGGPQALTTFARSIGNSEFRLDRWETALNTAIPGDPRDTSTPKAMGQSLQRLVLGDVLALSEREQLQRWLLGNTTGPARIKAGIPITWKIGDKTGGGQYGTANDIAVLWPPHRRPIVVAIYTTQHKKDATARNEMISLAAQVVVDWIGAI
ncbi:beta-lactamase Toho-1 [Abditibacteriota bacterium]|nr:beta-lactamase Toho-1 [Abditibacteriota bacterium]